MVNLVIDDVQQHNYVTECLPLRFYWYFYDELRKHTTFGDILIVDVQINLCSLTEATKTILLCVEIITTFRNLLGHLHVGKVKADAIEVKCMRGERARHHCHYK